MCTSAEWLSHYRVFPRIFSVFYLYGMHEVTSWFMHLNDPTTQQASFASAVIATGAAWFKFYVESGNHDK